MTLPQIGFFAERIEREEVDRALRDVLFTQAAIAASLNKEAADGLRRVMEDVRRKRQRAAAPSAPVEPRPDEPDMNELWPENE